MSVETDAHDNGLFEKITAPKVHTEELFPQAEKIPEKMGVFRAGTAIAYLFDRMQLQTRTNKHGSPNELQMPHDITYVNSEKSLGDPTREVTYPLSMKSLLEERDTLNPPGRDEKSQLENFTDTMKGEVEYAMKKAGTSKKEYDSLKQDLIEAQNNVYALQSGYNAAEVTQALERLSQVKQALEMWEKRFREVYVAEMVRTKKVGLRNISFEEGDDGQITAVVDFLDVPYGGYKNFRDPELLDQSYGRELLEGAFLTATATIVETADGQILLQYRDPRNAVYKGDAGIPGGMWDTVLEELPIEETQGNDSAESYEAESMPKEDAKEKTKRVMRPITTESALENIKKELKEEANIDDEDIEDSYLLGLEADLESLHSEALGYVKLSLTSEQLRGKILVNANDEQDRHFKEAKYHFIPATPEAIRDYVTKVHSFMPPTHLPGLPAVGRRKVYERVLEETHSEEQAHHQADAWIQNVEQEVQENYRQMHELVAAHFTQESWRTFALQYNQEHKNARNFVPLDPEQKPTGYVTSLMPEEQGLPPFEEEKRAYDERVKLLYSDK